MTADLHQRPNPHWVLIASCAAGPLRIQRTSSKLPLRSRVCHGHGQNKAMDYETRQAFGADSQRECSTIEQCSRRVPPPLAIHRLFQFPSIECERHRRHIHQFSQNTLNMVWTNYRPTIALPDSGTTIWFDDERERLANEIILPRKE
jgi:hypothetical protein